MTGVLAGPIVGTHRNEHMPVPAGGAAGVVGAVGAAAGAGQVAETTGVAGVVGGVLHAVTQDVVQSALVVHVGPSTLAGLATVPQTH